MHNLESEDLSNKVILEVGSGRGDTTCKLVDLLDGRPNSQLIVSDVSDKFFEQLQDEFRGRNAQIRFICTGAQELRDISSTSIDFVVCNYTLCAVNSQAGVVTLALRRFWEVLKPGGKLFIEEEFPIYKQDTPLQEIWAAKWRILKASMILAGRFPYNEIAPEILQSLCHLAGFENVEWTEHTEVFHDLDVLNFFRKRLDTLLTEIPVENIRAGFTEMANELQNKSKQFGGIEVPFYRFVAQKSPA